MTHAGGRALGGQDDAGHIAALSLVSFRKYKGINRPLLEARSRCKDASGSSFVPAAVSGCVDNPRAGVGWGWLAGEGPGRDGSRRSSSRRAAISPHIARLCPRGKQQRLLPISLQADASRL